MTTLATDIKSASISPKDAAMLIPVCLHSKLRYKFSATTFTISECEDIDKKFRSTVVAKMGYCSKTATQIINGSYSCGGVQIPSSWDLQGSNHLQLFVGHLQLQDLLGQYLLFIINLLHLHIGLLPRPLSHHIDIAKNTAPPSWVTNTWSYTSSIQATFITNSFQLSPQREYDSSLMAIASKYYSGITYERINAVCKCKRSFLVSDITTSDGKTVDKEYLFPGTSQTRRSNLSWPAQSLPGSKAWTEWYQFINMHLCSSNLKLHQHLGSWLPVKHKSQIWYSYHSPTTSLFYLYDEDEVWAICSQHASARRRIVNTHQTTRSLPTPLMPITVRFHNGLLITERHCNLLTISSVPPIPNPSSHEHFQSLPSSHQWILGSVLSPTPTELTHLIECIQEGSFVLGSDGSLKNSIGACASRLQSVNNPHVFIQLRNRVPASTVFTAETHGHLSILLLL